MRFTQNGNIVRKVGFLIPKHRDRLPIGEMKRTIEAVQYGAQPDRSVRTVLKHWNMYYYIFLASITAGGHNFALGHFEYLP